MRLCSLNICVVETIASQLSMPVEGGLVHVLRGVSVQLAARLAKIPVHVFPHGLIYHLFNNIWSTWFPSKNVALNSVGVRLSTATASSCHIAVVMFCYPTPFETIHISFCDQCNVCASYGIQSEPCYTAIFAPMESRT